MTLNWHIGDVIAKLREGQQRPHKEKTRAAFAKNIGMSAYWLGQIERTGKCNSTTLQKIAEALDKDPEYIYKEVPKPAPVAASDFCLEHASLCRQLEYIMHHGTNEKRSDMLRNTAEWIQGNVVTFYAALGGPPIQEINLKQPPHRAAPGHVRVRR